MNRKWVGLAALLVVVLAGAMIAYNVLAPGVEKSGNTGDSVPAAVDTDENGNEYSINATEGDSQYNGYEYVQTASRITLVIKPKLESK